MRGVERYARGAFAALGADRDGADANRPGPSVPAASNVAAPVSPLSPKIADIKLVDYDFAKYGTTAERKRLLERWDREVGSIAK